MSLANRFYNPNPEFRSAAGAAIDGGTLGFYLTGTSTPSAPYSDEDHTIAITNPIVLNERGSFDTPVFLDPAITYKVVLKDSAGNTIWTADPYYDPLLQQQAKFQVYAGDPNTHVAGTAGTPGGTPADVIFDTSNLIIWVCTVTGNAAAAVWTSTTGQISGAITFTGVISPAAINTDQNDYNPTGLASASSIRLNISGDCAITGLEGGSAGRIMILHNFTGSNRVVLKNNDAGSAADNRFQLGGDIYLDSDQSATLQYDAVTARWRMISKPYWRVVPPPQGRLTPTSGTPVLAADATAAGTVYYTPYKGNLCPVYDGEAFVWYDFAELSLTLNNPNHAANSLYDVFAIVSAGRVVLVTGPAWSVAGNYVSAGTLTPGTAARGTGAGTTELERVKGLYTNKVSMTGRNGATTYSVAANEGTYLGTIWIDATVAQVSCHVSSGQNRKWGVWNAYNRVITTLIAVDTSNQWAYTTNTIRPANNTAANAVTTLCGLPEERVEYSYSVYLLQSQSAGYSGVGYNSTTTTSGSRGWCGSSTAANVQVSATAKYTAVPAIGLNAGIALENGAGGTGTVWSVTGVGEGAMRMSAQWMA